MTKSKPWEGQDDQQLSKLVRKAKRRTMLRNVAITLVVIVVVYFGAIIGSSQLSNVIVLRTLNDEQLHMQITQPNVYISGYREDRGFMSGSVEFDSYKLIEGVPVIWETKRFTYDILRNFSMKSTQGSRYSIPLSDPQMIAENFEYYRGYNAQNGQRNLKFYIPGVDYNGKVLNDLSVVTQMDEDKAVELAISFDQGYTFEEVQAMLPDSLTPVWYWVDTYDNLDGYAPYEDGNGNMAYATPLDAFYNVYGFGVSEHVNSASPDVSDFIETLEFGMQKEGRYYEEYARIHDYLQDGDVQLFGVVVTGTPEVMQSLSGQTYVHAAVLGAVVELL